MRTDETCPSVHLSRQPKRQSFPDETLVVRQITLVFQCGNITDRNVIAEQSVIELLVKQTDIVCALAMNLSAERSLLFVPWSNQVGELRRRHPAVRGLL